MVAPKKKNSETSAPVPMEALVKHAQKTVVKTFKNSILQDNSADFPQFSHDELIKGKVLGKGGFGTVWEIRGFTVQDEGSSHLVKDDQDYYEQAQESRLFIVQHCLRKGNDARYAVKKLSADVVEDQGRFLQGMIDMAVETRFLSDIEHPNIVKLRAIAQVTPYDPEYFIVMDRLYDTLEKRLKTWEKKANGLTGLGKLRDRKGLKAKELYKERIVYAFDFAAAILYLHDRDILYRDIKPENVGFDIRGDIKLFDFGLAKELSDDLAVGDGTYNLTEMTGSLRYMAPEVALGKPYNKTCDVYSFAIMLWQMLALTVPFELYTLSSMKERVFSAMEKRPFIKEEWNVPMKLLLKRSWCADLTSRNSMKEVVAILKKECVVARGGDSSGLEHQRRRSTFVFRKPNGVK